MVHKLELVHLNDCITSRYCYFVFIKSTLTIINQVRKMILNGVLECPGFVEKNVQVIYFRLQLSFFEIEWKLIYYCDILPLQSIRPEWY